MDIKEAWKILDKFKELSNDETSEGWGALLHVYEQSTSYGHSEKFIKAVEKEMIEQATYIKEHAKIVEHKEMVEQKWTEVEWDYE